MVSRAFATVLNGADFAPEFESEPVIQILIVRPQNEYKNTSTCVYIHVILCDGISVR